MVFPAGVTKTNSQGVGLEMRNQIPPEQSPLAFYMVAIIERGFCAG